MHALNNLRVTYFGVISFWELDLVIDTYPSWSSEYSSDGNSFISCSWVGVLPLVESCFPETHSMETDYMNILKMFEKLSSIIIIIIKQAFYVTNLKNLKMSVVFEEKSIHGHVSSMNNESVSCIIIIKWRGIHFHFEQRIHNTF